MLIDVVDQMKNQKADSVNIFRFDIHEPRRMDSLELLWGLYAC